MGAGFVVSGLGREHRMGIYLPMLVERRAQSAER